ncbi:hypothetical protein AF332_16295 [Sporosarcina globispora]|uniref:Uncharacterized protein n=1 Tax=Sporosarcina globispora TaxID=1459 RepID=A0A0M0GE60_SPOGL|nr:hypothetical protein [Sporosarcina globispora]KON88210.1 hypothetical protein AF332_16295 [Sporosarcina globispora]
MSNQKIYILLTDTGTLLTRLIKLYTKKPYNHASISMDPDLHEVYSFGRKTANNPFIGGFVKENIRGVFFRKARCAVISCSVTDVQLNKLKAFINKIESEKDDYCYNLLGLFAIMFNKQISRNKAFFCSQFVATVLQCCGIVQFRKPPNLITPHEFMEMEDFHVVFQGNLEKYYLDLDSQTKEVNTYISSHGQEQFGQKLAIS